MVTGRSKILISSTRNAEEGVRRLLAAWDTGDFSGKRVAVKANFNSADPFPAGTDPLTLHSIFAALAESDAASITLAERSGMGDTRAVLESRGVLASAEEFGCTVRVIDSLPAEDFIHVQDNRHTWQRGFLLARDFGNAERIVTTCCLKTHRFGGHFTLSLKNSVGMIAKKNPADGYDYMRELHGSIDQRRLIAEINSAFSPDLVVLDGRSAFVRGGPESGTRVEPGIMLAGSDRVAMDAAGVAILRSYGTTPEVARGPIARLEQIARATELGLGTADPAQIDLVPLDPPSGRIKDLIQRELEGKGKIGK